MIKKRASLESVSFFSLWSTAALTIAFFVSPLIFFTDFTRNPYFFQITLLNVSTILLAIFEIYKRGLSLFSFEKIQTKLFIIFCASFFISSFLAFISASQFFKHSIAAENIRVWLFTIVNCFIPFAIASSQDNFEEDFEAKNLLFFCIFWGLLWFLFPFLKTQNSQHSLFYSFFDFYGAVLWTAGFWFIFSYIKKPSAKTVLLLPMTACLFSSIYGVLQYFGVEFIWAKLLTPYGRRAVSTFGNPNFASSYAVMIVPLAFYYLCQAKNVYSRIFYALTLLFSCAMIFASLTRSSLIGLFAAFFFLFAFKDYRKIFFTFPTAKKTALAIMLVFLLWPDENLKPASMGAAKRFYEGITASFSGFSLSVKESELYPSFHQRLLIWTTAGRMFFENPLFGKGWGNFELFYPYYQGSILAAYPNLKTLRTHANNAHNEILEILSQAGIVGAGLYLLFFLALFRRFFSFIKNADEVNKKFAISLAAAIVGMFFDNLFNVTLHFTQPAFLFWWITGTLSALIWKKNNKDAKNSKLVTIAIIIILLVVCFSWFNQLMREVYYFSGFKYMRKNLYSEAAADLQKAYSFHSREVNNNYELANAYTKLGQYEKAERYYQQALRSNAGYDEIFFNLAVVRIKMGKLTEAEKDFRTAIFINPFNKQAYQGLAEIYMRELKTNAIKGGEIIERGAYLFQYDLAFYDMAAYFYISGGEIAKAIDVYSRGLLKNPFYKPFYDRLLSLKANTKQARDAMAFYDFCKDIEAKVNSNPREVLSKIESGFAHRENYFLKYLSAKALFALGDLNSAQFRLNEVLKLRADFSDALYGLASVYEKKGSYKDAAETLKRLLYFEPQNTKVINKLEEVSKKI